MIITSPPPSSSALLFLPLSFFSPPPLLIQHCLLAAYLFICLFEFLSYCSIFSHIESFPPLPFIPHFSFQSDFRVASQDLSTTLNLIYFLLHWLSHSCTDDIRGRSRKGGLGLSWRGGLKPAKQEKHGDCEENEMYSCPLTLKPHKHSVHYLFIFGPVLFLPPLPWDICTHFSFHNLCCHFYLMTSLNTSPHPCHLHFSPPSPASLLLSHLSVKENQ